MEPCEILPGKDTETLLLEVLIPGVCEGINHDKDLGCQIHYHSYSPSRYENVDVWDVYGYVVRKGGNGTKYEYGSPEQPVVMIRIPRMNEQGLYNLHGDLYYIVTRQRLSASSPICLVDQKEVATKRCDCNVRSTNMTTLESREVHIRRVNKKERTSVMCIHHDSEAEKKDERYIPAATYILNSMCDKSKDKAKTEVLETMLTLIRLMGYQESVVAAVSLELLYTEVPTMPEGTYMLPHTMNLDGTHIMVPILGLDVTAESVSLLYILCHTLSVEAGLTSPDDQDNYANKIGELPAVLLALTIRKILRKDMHKKMVDGWNYTAIKIYKEIYNSMRENRWSVVDSYDTELQLSRSAFGIPVHGLRHALREVIIYRTTVSSATEKMDTYELRQANRSQRGILCMMMTPDDDNAGLRQYLAIDCHISSKFESSLNKSTLIADEVDELLLDIQEPDDGLWFHNYVCRGTFPIDLLMSTLESTKEKHPELSWHRVGNIIHSRYHYGRFMVKVNEKLYDAAELVLRVPKIQEQARPYAELPYSVPFMEHRPAARSLLGARIMGKSIGVPVVAYPNATSYTMLDPSDEGYPIPDVKFVDSVEEAMLSYSYGRQRPLVRTNVDSSLMCGTHVLLAEMPYKGYGVEDGLVVNRDAVARGMFAVQEKVFIVWDPKIHKVDRASILEVKVLKPIGSVLLENDIVVSICYQDVQGQKKYSYIRQAGAYRMYLSAVNKVYACGKGENPVIRDESRLARIEVAMYRTKFANTGDKVALPDGQKQVIVKVADPEDLPTLKPVEDNPVLNKIMEVRGYKPDVIMDPLSILSRSTMSQVLSSTLALRCIMQGDDYVETVPFEHTYYVKGDVKTKVVPKDVPRIKCVATLPNGIEVDNPVAIGCAYTILPPHLADTKPKGLGLANMDNITGMPHKSSRDTAVRMGWQEMYAVMHSDSTQLMNSVYNSHNRLDKYTYCSTCNSTAEVYEGACVDCNEPVTQTILLPKALRTVQLTAYGMGCSMKFSK